MERIARLVKWISVGTGACVVLAIVFSFINILGLWFFGNLAILGFVAAVLLTMVLLASWLGDQYKQGKASS